MRRGPKPAKSKEATPPVARKSSKDDGVRVRDLEKRLAEALSDKAAAQEQLQTRDSDLVEAREQQTATSEILRVISSSPTDVQPVFDALAESAVRLCGAAFSGVFRFDGKLLHLTAHAGLTVEELEAAQHIFPTRALPGGIGLSRVVLDRTVLQIADIRTDVEWQAALGRHSSLAPLGGYRTFLAVPSLHDDVCLGAINVWRREVSPFSEQQIDLLKTFADQAVIAIENVRLFTETKEALERQTATAEILRVISSSPADTQPVFDAIARSALRLCESTISVVSRFDGEFLHLAAHNHVSAEADDLVTRLFPTRPSRNLLHGRVVLDATVVHLPDIQADPEYQQSIAATYHARSGLGVPMLLDGRVLGVIAVARQEVRPFSDTQIELMKTFADQAVIAIENVRLFIETKEALERQTATAEILRVISSSPTDVQPVFEAIGENAVRLMGAVLASVYEFDGTLVHLRVLTPNTWPHAAELRQSYPSPPDLALAAGRVILSHAVLHIADLQTDSATPLMTRQIGERMGLRSLLWVPMLREGIPIGVIGVVRGEVGLFPDKQVNLLKTFADQAVIAIENVRLFNETKEALDQQTATSEVLRVIASSPTELQPVLDAMAESVARLCGVYDAVIWRLEGDGLRPVAHHGPVGSLGDRVVPMHRGTVTGRTVLDRQTVHVTDLQAEVDEFPEGSAFARQFGHRSIVSVPLLREGVAIGVMSLRRAEIQPFTEKQIDLLKTFADQAVIAIENVRLFTELQEKNRALTQALDQQTATSEILRVIASSPTDVRPVFEAILKRAATLCEAQLRHLWLYEGGEQFRLGAGYGSRPDHLQWLQQGLHRFGQPFFRESGPWRVGQFLDVRDTEPYRRGEPVWIRTADHEGMRTLLGVPLVKDGRLVGSIAVYRREVQPFTDQQTALVQTFADQAVIAIENVRLFNETKEALEQQTATAEILSVISGSPTDIQPVFDAVLDRALTLCEASHGSLYQLEGGELRHVAARGTFLVGFAVGEVIPLASIPGRVVLEKRTLHHEDTMQELDWQAPEVQAGVQGTDIRTVVAVPLLREQTAIGAIIIRRLEVRPFSQKQIRLLQTFADQAVIAIENVRLFKELQTSNRDLTTALDKQTATSDILAVISRSQTDVQPVFDAIVASAVRLLGAYSGTLTRITGEQIALAAITSTNDVGDAALRARFPQPLSSAGPHARAIRDRAPLNIADAHTDPRLPEAMRATARARGFRSWVVVPMLRHDEAIGTISLTRGEPGGFTDDEIELLQTFADQAVIAIENVRLFNELQTSNQELTTSLDKQTATSDILRVISQSPTDVQPVFDAIVQSAVRLCGAIYGNVYKVNGGEIHLVAHHNLMPEQLAQWQQQYPRPVSGSGAVPRAIRTGTVGLTADWEADSEWGVPSAGVQAAQRARGVRSILIVPMFQRQEIIGAIGLTHREVAAFTNAHVELLQTLADQAVIAIENVRLFTELQEKNRELTTSLAQQTATAEILRVISNSPTDEQPVFDAIVRSAQRLLVGHNAGL